MSRVLVENCCHAAVNRITWERIFLTLEVEVDYPDNPTPDIPLVFYLVNDQYGAEARFKQEQLDGGRYRLTLNITNQGENRCVSFGQYELVVCQGKRALASCVTAAGLVEELEAASRNFLYGARKRVYTITFFVEEGNDTLPFIMHVLPASKAGIQFPQGKMFRFSLWNPKKSFNKNRRPFLRAVYRHYRRRYRNNENTVLFMTEQNNTLGGNQVAVMERMKARGMDQQYTILTSARPAAAESQPMKSWFTVIKKMAKSNIIFVDDHAPILDWLLLDKETKVVQLWHAGAGFKSSGYSRWGHEGCPSPSSAHRQYSYGISGSKSIAPFFSEVWGINDEQVLPTGMPRIDEYLDPAYKEAKLKELYEKYPVCRGKKVILFAPTYRGRNKKTAYYPYELIDFERLYQVCGEAYVVLFKMHPWVPTDVPIDGKYKDKFMDVNKYPNINDLFYFTDLLITDYSSNIFEYSLMGNPMLFFAFDKIQYSFSRGFHRPYEESAPGKVCYRFDQVLEAIANKDFEHEKVKEYVDHHFDHIDSNSSDRVIDWLVLDKLPQDIRDELKAVKDANAAMRGMVFQFEDKTD